MIKINDIYIDYDSADSESRAINGLSMDVNDGDFVAIVGPSGSGKSSLLSGIAGLVPVNSGDIFINKNKISRVSRGRKSLIRSQYFGIIFQFSELINRFTVEENIKISWIAAQKKSEQNELDYIARLEYLTEQLNLHSILKRLPGKLSGGELQKAAIARAFIRQNTVILADEPSGDLDPENVQRLKNLLVKEHETGRTIVMVTHDMDLAGIASTVYHLEQGKVVKIVDKPSINN